MKKIFRYKSPLAEKQTFSPECPIMYNLKTSDKV